MLISTIIPAFNAECYINKTIHSALEQSVKQQIIVIDDGSTDETAAIVSRFVNTVELIRTPNRGVSAARNEGIRHAQGDFICFLDADDEWLPGKLDRQLALYNQYPELGTVITDEMHVDTVGKIIAPSYFATRPYHKELPINDGPAQYPLKWLIQECLVPTSSVMVRSHILKTAGLFDEKLSICEDRDMWLRLALQAPLGIIPEVLVHYLTNQAVSLSRVSRTRWACALCEVLGRYESILLDGLRREGSDPGLLAEQFISIGNTLWHNNDFKNAQTSYLQAIRLGNLSAFPKAFACMTGTVHIARYCKRIIRGIE